MRSGEEEIDAVLLEQFNDAEFNFCFGCRGHALSLQACLTLSRGLKQKDEKKARGLAVPKVSGGLLFIRGVDFVAFNGAFQIPLCFAQIFQAVVSAFLTGAADIFYYVTQMVSKSLSFDEVNNLNATVGIVRGVVDEIMLRCEVGHLRVRGVKR